MSFKRYAAPAVELHGVLTSWLTGRREDAPTRREAHNRRVRKGEREAREQDRGEAWRGEERKEVSGRAHCTLSARSAAARWPLPLAAAPPPPPVAQKWMKMKHNTITTRQTQRTQHDDRGRVSAGFGAPMLHAARLVVIRHSSP